MMTTLSPRSYGMSNSISHRAFSPTGREESLLKVHVGAAMELAETEEEVCKSSERERVCHYYS